MKIRPVENESFHAERWTDMKKANSPFFASLPTHLKSGWSIVTSRRLLLVCCIREI